MIGPLALGEFGLLFLEELFQVLDIFTVLLNKFFFLDDVLGFHAFEALEGILDILLVVGGVKHVGDFLVPDQFVAGGEFVLAQLDLRLQFLVQCFLL